MIVPPFDPPKLNDLTEWWTKCSYAGVQRLILEVQHLRLTLWELKSHVADASRRIRVLDPDMLAHGSARRLPARKGDRTRESDRPHARRACTVFGRMARPRSAALCTPPDPAEPGTLPCTIPEFQRITWAELRDRWRHPGDRKSTRQNVEQRMVPEIARQRSVILAREETGRRRDHRSGIGRKATVRARSTQAALVRRARRRRAVHVHAAMR
nr:hypothetical protein [Burkholderia anthina]